ncbi:hypothetical protein [Sedimentimonas flavescens]|uniref:hypothetical protein n=1 Tax=Sedimentimonas flavescens TaxID=2851012 RepID=UPI001C4A64AE|nr:hypothetical protein [Sedimentimonas flavescens]MBW0159695.1 hypothetical protein [Sedimentimonas flavescens]
MPFAKETASALGAEDIMKDAEVTDLFRRCQHHVDPQAYSQDILSQALDVTENVIRPQRGFVIAADGSSYEAAVSDGFPSARMGLLKIGQVWIDTAEYHKIDPRSGGEPDPIAIAKIEREKNTYSVPLTGAGIHLDGASPRESFRKSTFEAFRSKRFELLDVGLEHTLIDLLETEGRTVMLGGMRHVVIPGNRTCPITGEPLGQDVLIPEDKGEAPSPRAPNKSLYITDVLRLSEAFAEEGSNQQAYTRAMNAFEHLVLAHSIMRLDAAEHTRAILENSVFLVDGPLGIFGEPASLHRPIMKMIHRVRSRARGVPPLVIGVAKTGRVVEHGKLIQPLLMERFPRGRTVLLPISDAYRYRYIDFGAKNPESNFGNDTHYGQAFIVRSANDRIFELNIAYPFPTKSGDFQAMKIDLAAYGIDIGRAIGVLELFETELYEDANIVQHLAHRCASISHRPAGRTLDMFVRSIIGR